MTILEQLKEKVYEDRKALHLIPEAGFCEYKTSAYIQNVLKELDVEYELVGGTGIVALFKGISPTQTLAFRTDMDGLSVKEESSFETHSTHDNFMHACGHDGHMAMMLGLARVLSSSDVKIVDNILLIFQPAEEGPGGAEVLVNEGILEKYNVSEIYGIHVFPSVAQGKIGLCPGPMMAMTGEFDIDIYARSAHGAMPHTGIDGIVIASEVILGLQSIVSRNISPINPAVLTIGKMDAGERRNIIAGKARLEGTIRAFDKVVYNQIKTRMTKYLAGIEAAYEVKIEIEYRDMYPPVVNDQRLFTEFVNFHGVQCEVIEPQMISEDFSYYQEKVPGLFYFVGTYNEEKDYVYPLHNSKFNFDNRILLDGMQSYINILTYKGSIQI
ncbi:M20 family metallopeptidase [Fusibacter bizertensis]|uniref:M20 family metallopeptidase n=1 Tax=Fusibacter bizertensis TaxID=1488331 RepID=A0ABT6NAZ2_9FIRM|nr:M20 family metallopeptidase [Fusibacter bizertensis]MDH8677582.1 M20 family metallopeptidase [Fusibacter bizertensis]